MFKLLTTFLLSTLLSLSAYSATVQDITVDLGNIETFAVNKILLKENDTPLTFVTTPVLYGTDGKIARGDQVISLELLPDSNISVYIGSSLVSPGETKTINFNVTDTGGIIHLPIYPAENGKVGDANFRISLPLIESRFCPDTFTHNDLASRCEKYIFVTANWSCPIGTLDTQQRDCTLVTTKVQELTCPVGTVQISNGTCEATSTKTYTEFCTGAKTLSNSICSEELYKPLIINCSAGYSSPVLGTGKCSKTVTTALLLNCPAGYGSLNADTGLCSKTQITAILLNCPAGYTQSGTNCSKIVYLDLLQNCPEGYSQSGSSCSKTDYIYLLENCPSGYTKSGTSCSKTDYINLLESCPSG